MNNVISIKNVSLTYKERDIFKKIKGVNGNIGVKNVSFAVGEGEIFSIIGLNGAGKTSTLKCILGLIKPDEGEIEVFGKKELKGVDFEKVGYLPEISYYPKSMKLMDLMKYYGELYNIPRGELDEKIDKILNKLGLISRKNDRLEKFSKGMLQKVGIAQAILNNPKLLFLDEPMSGLDPLARELVIEIILELKSKGTTIFFNTHILEDVASIADRVAIINKGKLVEVLDIKKIMLEQDDFLLKNYFIKKVGEN
ncbi:MAG: ABC transporter ATP-binding protein [Psychrilyobacter sp.]|uniref:ABC transporter ATP-binding protein n=1 Tax=Psychrilyobacter sp. TaxID=2586924 RepID=UPI003C70B3FF